MDETESVSTPAASAALRTFADEANDAEAVFTAIHRLHALGRAVQVLADPDRREMPTDRVAWDGEMGSIEELGDLIATLADEAIEAASQLVHATRGRADHLDAWKRTALGDVAQ